MDYASVDAGDSDAVDALVDPVHFAMPVASASDKVTRMGFLWYYMLNGVGGCTFVCFYIILLVVYFGRRKRNSEPERLQ